MGFPRGFAMRDSHISASLVTDMKTRMPGTIWSHNEEQFNDNFWMDQWKLVSHTLFAS